MPLLLLVSQLVALSLSASVSHDLAAVRAVGLAMLVHAELAGAKHEKAVLELSAQKRKT